MNKDLHFYSQGRIITVQYTPKRQSHKSYSPNVLTISVGPANNDLTTHEVQLTDDYFLTHFDSLKDLFLYLRKRKDEEFLVQLVDSLTISIRIID